MSSYLLPFFIAKKCTNNEFPILLLIDFHSPGYASDPECGRSVVRGIEEGKRLRRKRRGEGRQVGRIENWQPLAAEKEQQKKKEKKKEEGEKKSRKYVHEILAGKSDELRSVRVEKDGGDEWSCGEAEGGREIYRAVQGGGEIPLTGLGRRMVEKVEGKAGEYVQVLRDQVKPGGCWIEDAEEEHILT